MGLSEAEVARRIGVHRQSVNRWNQRLAYSGLGALKKAGRAGRKSQLEPSDLRRVEAGLRAGPKALGDKSAKWTTRSVAELIENTCRVSYTTVHVWRILRQLGWHWKHPSWRPPEQSKASLIPVKKGRAREVKKVTKSRAQP
jgi:transposase